MIYLREAHPSDGWAKKGWSKLEDAENLNERREAAETSCANLDIDFPTVLDTMKDDTACRWSGWPERLVVVSKSGKVVYTGDQGPFGFKPVRGQKLGRNKVPGIALGDFLERYLK